MHSPLINDDWIAVKEFPLFSKNKNDSSNDEANDASDGGPLKDKTDSYQLTVSWDESSATMNLKCNIFDVSRITSDGHKGAQVEYVNSFHIDILQQIHEQIKSFIPDNIPDFPVKIGGNIFDSFAI